MARGVREANSVQGEVLVWRIEQSNLEILEQSARGNEVYCLALVVSVVVREAESPGRLRARSA